MEFARQDLKQQSYRIRIGEETLVLEGADGVVAEVPQTAPPMRQVTTVSMPGGAQVVVFNRKIMIRLDEELRVALGGWLGPPSPAMLRRALINGLFTLLFFPVLIGIMLALHHTVGPAWVPISGGLVAYSVARLAFPHRAWFLTDALLCGCVCLYAVSIVLVLGHKGMMMLLLPIYFALQTYTSYGYWRRSRPGNPFIA